MNKVVDINPNLCLSNQFYSNSNRFINMYMYPLQKGADPIYINYNDVCFGTGEERPAAYYMKMIQEWYVQLLKTRMHSSRILTDRGTGPSQGAGGVSATHTPIPHLPPFLYPLYTHPHTIPQYHTSLHTPPMDRQMPVKT